MIFHYIWIRIKLNLLRVKRIILKSLKIRFENLKNIYKSKQTVGIGFDVHRLVPKRNLFSGLKIKSNLGTLGH